MTEKNVASKIKFEKANTFVDRCIKSCHVVAEVDGFFMSEHSEDLSTVEGEQPGSMVGQWPEVLELMPAWCSFICKSPMGFDT